MSEEGRVKDPGALRATGAADGHSHFRGAVPNSPRRLFAFPSFKRGI